MAQFADKGMEFLLIVAGYWLFNGDLFFILLLIEEPRITVGIK